jgi:hypothetical protein
VLSKDPDEFFGAFPIYYALECNIVVQIWQN